MAPRLRSRSSIRSSRGFDEFFGFLGGGAQLPATTRRNRNAILRGTRAGRERRRTLTDAFARRGRRVHRAATKARRSSSTCRSTPSTPRCRRPRSTWRAFADIKDPTAADLRRDACRRWTTPSAACLAKLARHEARGEHADLLPQRQRRPDATVNASRNDPLRGFKAQTWEGGIRVPFLVQWKGTLPAGKVYDSRSSSSTSCRPPWPPRACKRSRSGSSTASTCCRT